jgi:hypothetical protein
MVIYNAGITSKPNNNDIGGTSIVLVAMCYFLQLHSPNNNVLLVHLQHVEVNVHLRVVNQLHI